MVACSDAVIGWTLAHSEIGVSVNPIPTRGANYAHCITACPPAFENLTASLVTFWLVKGQLLDPLKCQAATLLH